MKTNFTLCFYEFPGALHEIKQWESIKFDDIIEKKVCVSSKVRFYKIKLNKKKCNDFELEILMCIPMINFNIIFNIKDIKNNIKKYFGSDKIIYYKSILFGKINSKNLNKIKEIVEYFESNFK